jgi:seryl-tRNA synthetase
VPWIVDAESSNFTHNSDDGKFILNDIDSKGMWAKHLVGSAEQGFIQLKDSLVANKRYMSISPCFRKGEDDETHCEQFMKLELFMISHPVNKIEDLKLKIMFIHDAILCFKRLGYEHLECVQTSEQNMDIMATTKSPWLELGSYGCRDIFDVSTSTYRRIYYGTGLALPRFQLVI